MILYDTGCEEDININEIIAKAVMEETEARMMAEGTFHPATVSTETSPVKGLSNKSTNLEQAIDRLHIVGEQKVTISENDAQAENEDSEESWETEEEEEVIPAKQPVKKKDKNSNTVSPSANKNFNSNVTSGATANVSDNTNNKTPTDQKSKSPDPDTRNLYSWGKSSPDQDYMDDTKALWDSSVYWKRPLPPLMEIPKTGEYMDCHVCKVFDPTNFVVCILHF